LAEEELTQFLLAVELQSRSGSTMLPGYFLVEGVAEPTGWTDPVQDLAQELWLDLEAQYAKRFSQSLYGSEGTISH
jgi:hypothetical protein